MMTELQSLYKERDDFWNFLRGRGLLDDFLRFQAYVEAAQKDEKAGGAAPTDRSGGQTTATSFAENYPTGAVRDSRKGKGRYDLISPVAERRLALALERGGDKYGDARNWEKGQPLSRYVDSLKRHLNQFLMGEYNEDHLAAVFWNAMALLHTHDRIDHGKLPQSLNDLSNFQTKNGTRAHEVFIADLLSDADNYLHDGSITEAVNKSCKMILRDLEQPESVRHANLSWTPENVFTITIVRYNDDTVKYLIYDDGNIEFSRKRVS